MKTSNIVCNGEVLLFFYAEDLLVFYGEDLFVFYGQEDLQLFYGEDPSVFYREDLWLLCIRWKRTLGLLCWRPLGESLWVFYEEIIFLFDGVDPLVFDG